jgi:hypothetical protein
MAHVFTIINSSNETVVYNDYDLIPLTTLKHVIKFLPDLGTSVPSHEIILESHTILETTGGEVTATFTGDNFVILSALSVALLQLFVSPVSVVDLQLVNSSGIVLRTVKGGIVSQNGAVGFAINDSSGTLITQFYLNNTDPGVSTVTTTLTSALVIGPGTSSQKHKLVPENFADGTENHLILELIDGDIIFGPFVRLETGTTDVLLNETGGKIIFDNVVGDAAGADHYHQQVGDYHEAGDGHTEEEHREISLWNHKLQVLMTRERLNNASS